MAKRIIHPDKIKSWQVYLGNAESLPLPDNSVHLTMFSPPYVLARSYSIGAVRSTEGWIDWMLKIVAESLRVTRNCVIVVAASHTRDYDYNPACEGLMYRWFSEGWNQLGAGYYSQGSMFPPLYWNKVSGVPGSGGKQWFRKTIEYIMCFKKYGPLDYANTIALGGSPKYASRRTNARNQDGTRSDRLVADVDISRPGSLLTIPVGGGHMGHPSAHMNEAPYPETLCRYMILALTKRGHVVLDPFCGSGTTLAAAVKLNRRAIGIDIRQTQVALTTRRMRSDRL